MEKLLNKFGMVFTGQLNYNFVKNLVKCSSTVAQLRKEVKIYTHA